MTLFQTSSKVSMAPLSLTHRTAPLTWLAQEGIPGKLNLKPSSKNEFHFITLIELRSGAKSAKRLKGPRERNSISNRIKQSLINTSKCNNSYLERLALIAPQGPSARAIKRIKHQIAC